MILAKLFTYRRRIFKVRWYQNKYLSKLRLHGGPIIDLLLGILTSGKRFLLFLFDPILNLIMIYYKRTLNQGPREQPPCPFRFPKTLGEFLTHLWLLSFAEILYDISILIIVYMVKISALAQSYNRNSHDTCTPSQFYNHYPCKEG